jgi:hypothetical protein
MMSRMQGRDDVHPAAVRMRAAAPVAAFAAPVMFLVAAAAVTAVAGDAAALWLVSLAAPFVVVAAVFMNSAPPLVVIVLAGIASAPLWSMGGRMVARRTIDAAKGAAQWRSFWSRYVRLVAAWAAVATVISFWVRA